MKRLRVLPTDSIVCYDSLGLFSAPRAAWMFRFFGAENVRILNGGLKKWKLEGRPLVSGPQIFPDEPTAPFDYKVVNENRVILDINKVHNISFYLYKKDSNYQILDARAAARFNGEVAEPRKGVRSGNITGSKNLPFTELIEESNGCLKSDKELAKIFLAKGVDTTLATVNSCGSGVTACVLDLGLSILGADKSIIYDGSWTEYVSNFFLLKLDVGFNS